MGGVHEHLFDVGAAKRRLEEGTVATRSSTRRPGSRWASTCSSRPSPTASPRTRTTRSTSSSRAAARLQVEDEEVDLAEGQAMFVAAHAEHRFTAYERLSLLVIFTRPT